MAEQLGKRMTDLADFMEGSSAEQQKGFLDFIKESSKTKFNKPLDRLTSTEWDDVLYERY